MLCAASPRLIREKVVRSIRAFSPFPLTSHCFLALVSASKATRLKGTYTPFTPSLSNADLPRSLVRPPSFAPRPHLSMPLPRSNRMQTLARPARPLEKHQHISRPAFRRSPTSPGASTDHLSVPSSSPPLNLSTMAKSKNSKAVVQKRYKPEPEYCLCVPLPPPDNLRTLIRSRLQHLPSNSGGLRSRRLRLADHQWSSRAAIRSQDDRDGHVGVH